MKIVFSDVLQPVFREYVQHAVVYKELYGCSCTFLWLFPWL